MAVACLCAMTGLSAQAQTNAGASANIARAVQVTAKRSTAVKGMLALTTIKISGGVKCDSYDSDVGPYNPASVGQNSFVGTVSKASGSFSITGSAKVMGKVGTGAPGVFNNAGSASVGSKAFVSASKSGVEAGALQDDLNLVFPSVVLPFDPLLGVPPLAGTVDGTNYTFVLGRQNYVIPSLSLSAGQTLVVTNMAVLYVTNAFDLASGASIIIQAGGSLDLYVGKTASMNGGVVNLTSKPEFMNYYGLKSNTSFFMASSAQFIGRIYAPNTSLQLAGNADIYGSCVAKDITLSGTFEFHYDEALGRKGTTFIVTSWKEL